MANWGSDTPISMPIPMEGNDEILVPMYGFGFSHYGLYHDLTRVDYERHRIVSSAPASDPSVVIEDDYAIEHEGDFL